MSKEIQGNLVNLYLRDQVGESTFLVLTCTEDLQFQITTEVSKRRTNCGIKTSVADVDFNVSGNAVQNADPTASEVSHTQMKAWMIAKQKLEFQYKNIAAAGILEGEGVNSFGNLYITDLTSTSSAEADGILSFSFTAEGTGVLDEFDES